MFVGHAGASDIKEHLSELCGLLLIVSLLRLLTLPTLLILFLALCPVSPRRFRIPGWGSLALTLEVGLEDVLAIFLLHIRTNHTRSVK